MSSRKGLQLQWGEERGEYTQNIGDVDLLPLFCAIIYCQGAVCRDNNVYEH